MKSLCLAAVLSLAALPAMAEEQRVLPTGSGLMPFGSTQALDIVFSKSQVLLVIRPPGCLIGPARLYNEKGEVVFEVGQGATAPEGCNK